MITLKQARERGKLDQFVAEREALEGEPADADTFHATLKSMAGKPKSEPETSPPDCDDEPTPSLLRCFRRTFGLRPKIVVALNRIF